jgi:hypothetical protein
MNQKTALVLGLLLALAFIPQVSAALPVPSGSQVDYRDQSSFTRQLLNEAKQEVGRTLNDPPVPPLTGAVVQLAGDLVGEPAGTAEAALSQVENWIGDQDLPFPTLVSTVEHAAEDAATDPKGAAEAALDNAPDDSCDENPDDCTTCNGYPGPCSCDGPNPPVTCPTDCSDPRDSDYCHALYCNQHPDYSSCTGDSVKCGDGFYGWDTDHDGTCDNDDLDDDNDGVPDKCDNANDPVDNAYEMALYALQQCA